MIPIRKSFTLGPPTLAAIERWHQDFGMKSASEALEQMVETAAAAADLTGYSAADGPATVQAERRSGGPEPQEQRALYSSWLAWRRARAAGGNPVLPGDVERFERFDRAQGRGLMFTAQVFYLPAKRSDFASAAGDTELEAVRAALKVEYPMYCRGEPEAVHVVDGMRTDDPHLRFVITTEPAPPSDLQPLLDSLDTEAARGTLFGARVEEVDPGIPLAFITALPDPGWPDPSSRS